MNRSGISLSVLCATVLLVGCGSDSEPLDTTPLTTVSPSTESPGLANPASVYCVEQGGTVEIETAEDGSQSGICVLPDGTRVDEWEYFRSQGATDSTDG